MSWNIDELHAKIASLESQINKVEDPVKLYGLHNDLANLKSMVNYKLGKRVYDFQYQKGQILDKNHFAEMVQSLSENSKNFLNELTHVAQLGRIPWNISLSRKLSSNETEELIVGFLKYFDENLLILYNQYKKQNRIEVNRRAYESVTCRGKCYHLSSEGSGYISTRFNNRISMLPNIPHELGHAYQYSGKTDSFEIQKCLYSLFGEAYPIFLEFAFLDYLKQTRYRKNAFTEEGLMLDGFLCQLEYNLGDFLSVPSTYYSSDDKTLKYGYNAKSENNTLILSNMLAMYWFAIFKDDPKEAKAAIAKFNSGFGFALEGETFKEYTAEDLAYGVKFTINDYLKNYRLKR